MTVPPRFTHDCKGCHYLGQDAEHDFYFCPSPMGMPTVIARYGNEGPEYSSGLEIARQVRAQLDFEYPLAKALTLAEERGLVERPPAVAVDLEDPTRVLVCIDSAMLDAKIVPRRQPSVEERARVQASLHSRLLSQFQFQPLTPQTLHVASAHLAAWLKEWEYSDFATSDHVVARKGLYD